MEFEYVELKERDRGVLDGETNAIKGLESQWKNNQVLETEVQFDCFIFQINQLAIISG